MKNFRYRIARILKSKRCPKSSQYRPIKADPFHKQGTELKTKSGLSPLSNTYDIASTNIWIDNHASISSAGIPFCHAQISGRSWCWPNRKRDMSTRDWSYSLSQKKTSYTALALWECVKQLKHFENKKKCRDNVVRTLWQPSDVQVVVRAVQCCKGSSDWWTFLTMNITTICCDKV